MTCIELCVIGQNLSLKSEDLAILAFKKFRTHPPNRLKSSPVSERSAKSLQNYICFSPLTSVSEIFGHKSTPSDRPWIEAYWAGSRMPKGQYLGQRTLGCHSLSSLLFGHFSSPTNIHTHSSQLFTLN